MPCDFCGKERKKAGTIFVGDYCVECHKANIAASKQAIINIKTGKKTTQGIDKVAFQKAFGDVATLKGVKL